MPTPTRARAKKRKGPGRPPSDINWQGCSVRFTPDEKRELSSTVRSVGVSQAEFIREGTMRLVETVKKEGKLQLTARPV